jgi:2-iminobutanoate/2-iminopropanoate deaminase
MLNQAINTANAPKAIGPYSQAIAAGNLVYTSGQIALTPKGKLVEGSIQDETAQVMKNLKAILGAAETSFGSVIKTTIYLTDISAYPEVNAVYSEYMQEPYPARECVGIMSLPLGARVEISMVAARIIK